MIRALYQVGNIEYIDTASVFLNLGSRHQPNPSYFFLRQSRDYDRVQQLMFEALHYFAVLARLGRVDRHDTLCTRY